MTDHDPIAAAKVAGAEAVLTALYESLTTGGYSLGRVVERWRELAGVSVEQAGGLYSRFHAAGGLTVNNVLVDESDHYTRRQE